MQKFHRYNTSLKWEGNKGMGTAAYRAYSRDHIIKAGTKAAIRASSDPSFMGNPANYNPEELLVASLSSCHMLWYLHLCSVEGVVVVDYEDHATGVMAEEQDGSGHFTEVILGPVVTVTAEAMKEQAIALHAKAHVYCFIANSVNFPVRHQPQIKVASGAGQ